MEGHLGCPENYSRVFCDSECMGQEGLPSTRARSHVVGSLPARPGHSRDTPVTETTWTYSRHLGQVERQTPEIPSSRRSAFCNLWRLWNREKVSAVPPGSPMTARHSFPLLDRCASP